MDYDAVLTSLEGLVGRSVTVSLSVARDTTATVTGELLRAEATSLRDAIRAAPDDHSSYETIRFEVGTQDTHFVLNRARFKRAEQSGPLLLVFLHGDIALAITPAEPG
jgi:hypothetical protein